MEGLVIVALICSFLPFLVSLGGRGGVWKFLSFLFCCFSLVGAVSVIGIGGGVLAWIIAWIFTAIAAQSRRSEERFAQLERNMLVAKALEEDTSPVGRLLLSGSKKPSFISLRQLAALVLVFGLGTALIVIGVNETKAPPDTVTTRMAVYASPTPEFIATVDNEALWRADNPPKQWPKFTIVPGEKPLPARTSVQKIAIADAVINNWDNFQSRKSKKRPTSSDSGTAISYLTTIEVDDSFFKSAWPKFIRLRQVDREIGRSRKLEP
jgi:hypothetical protein